MNVFHEHIMPQDGHLRMMNASSVRTRLSEGANYHVITVTETIQTRSKHAVI